MCVPSTVQIVFSRRELQGSTHLGGWVAKLVAHPFAMAALWVRIQTSLNNTKWAT